MSSFGKTVADTFEIIGSIYSKFKPVDKTKHIDPPLDKITHLIRDADLDSPQQFYAFDGDTPNIKFKRALSTPFLDIMDGSFPSTIETPFPVNNTVYVRHFRVKPQRQGRPCVVMINGLNLENNFYFDWWCWRFAAWGIDSVLLNTAYSQKRVPEGALSGDYIFTPDTLWTLLAVKQSYFDARQLVKWLATNGAGDIGMFGVSFGALVCGIYACHATDASFAVLGMPPVDVVKLLGNWDFADELRAREACGETTLLTDPRVRPLLNHLDMKPVIPRDRIFIAKGLYDHLVDPEDIDRTAENWGGLPWLRTYETGHLNTFIFNLRFIEDVRKFIHQEIL